VKKVASGSKLAVKQERQPAKKKRPREVAEEDEDDDDDEEEEEEDFVLKKKKKVCSMRDRVPWPSKPATINCLHSPSHFTGERMRSLFQTQGY